MDSSKKLVLGTCLGCVIGLVYGYYRGVENERPYRITQTDLNLDGRPDLIIHSQLLPNAFIQNKDGSYIHLENFKNELDERVLENKK